MPEVCIELENAFTTADTVTPVSVCYDGQALVVSFANYSSPLQKITFSDVRAFSWTGWDEASADAVFDGICEVRGSRLLAPWIRFSAGALPFRHFRLGFNAEGKFLDVVASRMAHETIDQNTQQ